MLITIDNSKIKGSGTQLYSVSVTESTGGPLKTVLWLAEDDHDLEHQLYEDFLGEQEEDYTTRAFYNVEVRPKYVIGLIGSVA